MRRKAHKNHQKRSAGKVLTGLLLGSVVGATVGWLSAPASGEETRRRIRGEVMGIRERAKSAAGNVESTARELIAEANQNQQLP
jgi:gas vesicle protein